MPNLTQNPNLAQVIPGSPVNVENVVNPNFQNINSFQKEVYDHSQRLIGGGWTNDEIADKAITTNNVLATYDNTTASNSFIFGKDFVDVLVKTITADADNSLVLFNYSLTVETGLAGKQLYRVVVERGEDLAFTNLNVIDDRFFSVDSGDAGLNFEYLTLASSALSDLNTVKGTTYYYRLRVKHDRIEGAVNNSNVTSFVANISVQRLDVVILGVSN